MKISCWCSHIDVFRLWRQYVYTLEWFCVGLNQFGTNGVNMAKTHTEMKEKKKGRQTVVFRLWSWPSVGVAHLIMTLPQCNNYETWCHRWRMLNTPIASRDILKPATVFRLWSCSMAGIMYHRDWHLWKLYNSGWVNAIPKNSESLHSPGWRIAFLSFVDVNQSNTIGYVGWDARHENTMR